MRYTGKIKVGDVVVFTRNCYSSRSGRELLIIKGRPYRVINVSNSSVTVVDLLSNTSYKKHRTTRNIEERMIVLDSEIAGVLYGN